VVWFVASFIPLILLAVSIQSIPDEGLYFVQTMAVAALFVVSGLQKFVQKRFVQVVSIVLFSIPLLATFVRMVGWQQVRSEYPTVSLAPRLEYETSRSKFTVPSNLKLQSDEQEFVDLMEREAVYNVRRRSLAAAHASRVQQFIKGPGFGVGRMLTPEPFRASSFSEVRLIPQREKLPLPSEAISASDETPVPVREIDLDRKKLGGQLRIESLNQFFNERDFGLIIDRQHVAGFIPHRFVDFPDADHSHFSDMKIQRIELVSLLKHDPPAVYLSDNLPNMAELTKVPVRPLDDFEQRGLLELRAGETFYMEEFPRKIRMLGSLLAYIQCCECHSVPEHTLLGAFSYQIGP